MMEVSQLKPRVLASHKQRAMTNSFKRGAGGRGLTLENWSSHCLMSV